MNDVIVLCYHAVSVDWEADLSTTPARLERQLELLVRRGYRGATFTEATGPPTNRRTVAVTFDDAFRSVFELARPILERFELVATVFVPTDFIDAGGQLRWSGIDQWRGGPHEHELAPMSWEELRALHAAGWEIGSHTGAHPHLTEVDDATLQSELTRSKAVCEQNLGQPCSSLAYPYGDVDARVVGATKLAGYSAAAALPRRLDERGALEWPRVGVYRADDDLRFRLKLSPALRRLRRTSLWESLYSARGALARS